MPERGWTQVAPSRLLRAVVTVLLACALGLQGVAASRAQSFEERALKDANDRVAAVESRLRAARGTAEVAAERLAQMNEDVRILEDAVNQAAEAVAQQQAEVDRAALRLETLAADEAAVEQALIVQVVTLFKRGSSSRFDSILSAGDVNAAIERAEFVRVLSTGEKALLEHLSNARVLVAAQQERFAAQQARLLAIQEAQVELFARASAARDEAASWAADANQTVKALQREQDDLERDARALRDLILRNSAAPTSGLSPSTAGYIWPICGVVTSEYGYRWGRLHAGLDIDGDTGDIIAAAKAGVVKFAGWQGGYGNLTLIDHGDGVFTAYGHQSKFFVSQGDSVVRGQKIGAVGNTGQSTGSHLHFETRVNGEAENPRRFLTGSC